MTKKEKDELLNKLLEAIKLYGRASKIAERLWAKVDKHHKWKEEKKKGIMWKETSGYNEAKRNDYEKYWKYCGIKQSAHEYCIALAKKLSGQDIDLSACSSVWTELLATNQEVGGSNPSGRATPLGDRLKEIMNENKLIAYKRKKKKKKKWNNSLSNKDKVMMTERVVY